MIDHERADAQVRLWQLSTDHGAGRAVEAIEADDRVVGEDRHRVTEWIALRVVQVERDVADETRLVRPDLQGAHRRGEPCVDRHHPDLCVRVGGRKLGHGLNDRAPGRAGSVRAVMALL